MDNRSISHTRWKCQYHIVFIPKYRKKVLYGKVRDDVREIISVLCKYKDVEIMLDYSSRRTVTLGEITPEWWIK